MRIGSIGSMNNPARGIKEMLEMSPSAFSDSKREQGPIFRWIGKDQEKRRCIQRSNMEPLRTDDLVVEIQVYFRSGGK